MHILHLITRMDRGGSAVNTLLSAIGQQQAGHRVVLAFGPTFESEMSRPEQAAVDEGLGRFRTLGGEVAVLPSLLRGIGRHDIVAFGEVRRLLRRGFDIVHTHTSKAGALGRLAATGLRTVHTPHGHVFHGYFGPAKTRLFVAIERWLAHRTAALIALTGAEMEEHLALGIGRRDQWHVVPSGVDVEAIGERVAALRAAGGGRRWQAVSVGRLVPVKGTARLLSAWQQVVARRPAARLAIVGDGPERSALEALCDELGLRDAVHFAGWADPLPYLAATDCFVLLSFNEGMGRAAVEALAAGLPCVVADVCGLAEVVTGEVGARVDAGDADAVARALLQDWPASLPAAAVQRARRFSVERMVEELERIYGRLS